MFQSTVGLATEITQTLRVTRPSNKLIKFEVCEGDRCRPILGETGVYRLEDLQKVIDRKIKIAKDREGLGLIQVGLFVIVVSAGPLAFVHLYAPELQDALGTLRPLPVLGGLAILWGARSLFKAQAQWRKQIAEAPETQQSRRLNTVLALSESDSPNSEIDIREVTQNLVMDLSPLHPLTSCELALQLPKAK